MNKFNLQEGEKSRILSMHKALIKEQLSGSGDPKPPATPETPAAPKAPTPDVPKSIEDQLQGFIDNGCVKNGNVVKMRSGKSAIKQESTKTPGKFRYFFIDNTVGMADETGKFQILPNKWACNTAAIAATNTTQKLSDDVLQEKKNKEGWMEYSELPGKGYSQLEADQGKYTTEKFKTKTGQVITLYKPKTGAVMGGQQQGMSAEQKAFITKWEGKKGKLKLTPEEQASRLYRQIEIPGSREVTGWETTGLKMFFSVDDIKDISGESKDLKTTIENQRISLDECKAFVDQFFAGYQDDTDIPDFDIVKRKVQRCKSLYSPNPTKNRKNKWGIFSGQKNKIDILSGLVVGQGPSRRGEDAKWRLN
jgi:hypothetical protein